MRLVVTTSEKSFPLKEGENIIGRADLDAGFSPEIDLEPLDSDSKVSRRHACVIVKGNDVILQDIGSLNGTYLNRTDRLEPGKAYPLKAGDEVMIGKVFLKLKADS